MGLTAGFDGFHQRREDTANFKVASKEAKGRFSICVESFTAV